eukprot:g33497.t1
MNVAPWPAAQSACGTVCPQHVVWQTRPAQLSPARARHCFRYKGGGICGIWSLCCLQLPRLQRRIARGSAGIMDGKETAAQVGQNGANLPTSAALELYAFYKQATCGDCPTSRPMGFQASGFEWRQRL